ncbi:MAG: hypothetical protein QXW97_00885 [Candidatus Pacearchaeota archaeon]
MDNFIKKIFEGKIDDYVHVQFQKFSRGEFQKRAMFRIKNSSGNYIIDSTYEYAREFVRSFAEKLGDNKTLVTGALVSTLDLEGIFKYSEKKIAMGVKKYYLNREMSGKELIELCDKIDKAFFGLSLNVGSDELKIKDKSPKSAKGISSSPKDDDENLKIDFIKIKTNDKSIVENMLFDIEVKDFKKVEVRHDFIISDIIIPPELKNEKDFSKIREMALRKGKVIRFLDVDGKKIKKEKEFCA